MPTFAQSFDCYNYGSFSQCQMANGSQMTCYPYGSFSQCQVTHPNGFVSTPTNPSGDGPGPAALLIEAIIRLHQEHAASKAAKNAESAMQVNLSGAALLSDMAGVWKASPEQSKQMEEFQEQLRQDSDRMNELASILAREVGNKNNSHFYGDPKRFQQLYDLSLLRVCIFSRAWDENSYRKFLLSYRTDPRLPSQLKLAFDAVEADVSTLDKDCNSPEGSKAQRRANKLIAHEPPKLQQTSNGKAPTTTRKVGRDGTDWGTLTRNQQASYASGFADGYEQGAMEGGGLDEERRMYAAQEIRAALTASGAPKAHLTVLFGDAGANGYQVADAVSAFYNDFKNVRVCWNLALVFSVEALAGEPPTEERLNEARKVSAEQGCT